MAKKLVFHPSRLEHIGNIKDATLGASQKAVKDAADLSKEVKDLTIQITDITTVEPRDSFEAISKRDSLTRLTKRREELREKLAAAVAVREASQERFNAASTLFDRCEKFWSAQV